jgi:hypothetical protein
MRTCRCISASCLADGGIKVIGRTVGYPASHQGLVLRCALCSQVVHGGEIQDNHFLHRRWAATCHGCLRIVRSCTHPPIPPIQLAAARPEIKAGKLFVSLANCTPPLCQCRQEPQPLIKPQPFTHTTTPAASLPGALRARSQAVLLLPTGPPRTAA